MNKIVRGTALICSLVFFSCKHKPPPKNPTVPVNLYTVKAQTVFYYDKYPSTTQALSQVTLLPQVQGYITGIFFREGTLVKKGQKLYEIDKRLYQAAVDAAVANLRVAEGNQEQAQQDADRYVYLNSYHAVAKQLYDHAVITLQNAKSQVKSAQEAVNTAKTNLTYAVIYAPFDGTIGFSQVKMGNLVSVGQTILNTISTNDPMAVDFLINEKQLTSFEILEKRKQRPVDSLFTILLPNNSLYPFTGKISVIDRAVDPQTGSIRVRLEFPNHSYILKAGMSCLVRVHNIDSTPQLVVPGRAVVEQMGEYFVFVVKDSIPASRADSLEKKAEDTATEKGPRLYAYQKKIALGQTIGANVIVKDGLNEGEKIVVDGIQSLHDGSRVSPGGRQGARGAGGKDGAKGNETNADTKMDSSKNNQ